MAEPELKMLEVTPKTRLVAVVTVALLALSTASGCAGLGRTHTSQGSADAIASQPVVSGAQPVLPAPSAIANDLGKRKRVAITACQAVGGGWHAEGTVAGSSSQKQSYKVVVYFTSPSATVLAFGDTTVTVQPGKVSTWEVRQSFAAPRGTLCVLRAVS